MTTTNDDYVNKYIIDASEELSVQIEEFDDTGGGWAEVNNSTKPRKRLICKLTPKAKKRMIENLDLHNDNKENDLYLKLFEFSITSTTALAPVKSPTPQLTPFTSFTPFGPSRLPPPPLSDRSSTSEEPPSSLPPVSNAEIKLKEYIEKEIKNCDLKFNRFSADNKIIYDLENSEKLFSNIQLVDDEFVYTPTSVEAVVEEVEERALVSLTTTEDDNTRTDDDKIIIEKKDFQNIKKGILTLHINKSNKIKSEIKVKLKELEISQNNITNKSIKEITEKLVLAPVMIHLDYEEIDKDVNILLIKNIGDKVRFDFLITSVFKNKWNVIINENKDNGEPNIQMIKNDNTCKSIIRNIINKSDIIHEYDVRKIPTLKFIQKGFILYNGTQPLLVD